MKPVFPLLQPKKQKKPTTVNLYTQHMKKSSQLTVVLITLVVCVICVATIFTTPIKDWIQSHFHSSSSSSQSTSTPKTALVTIKTTTNQSCQLNFDTHDIHVYNSVNNSQSLVYKPGESCAVEGFESLQVVNLPQAVDQKAKLTYSPIGSVFTIFVYAKDTESARQIDVERYQAVLVSPIVPASVLFDTNKSLSSLRDERMVYYLSTSCSNSTSPCELWRLNQIDGTLEKLYAFLYHNSDEIRFAKTQINKDSIIITQKQSDQITLHFIDKEINNRIIKQTRVTSDSDFSQY